jgi:hypothetical protein
LRVYFRAKLLITHPKAARLSLFLMLVKWKTILTDCSLYTISIIRTYAETHTGS